jgi:hypothetical protein
LKLILQTNVILVQQSYIKFTGVRCLTKVQSMFFFFRATDSGQSTGTATITITVTDVNEPIFSASSYDQCIVDKSAVGKYKYSFNP